MKHLLKLSTLFAVLILFAGCNKEDDKIPTPTNPIIGKWTLVSYEISNFENTGQTVEITEDLLPRPTIEFKTNGTCCIENFDGDGGIIGYEIVGEKIFFNEDVSFGLNHKSFYYTISENTMILTRTDSYFNPNYTENTKVVLTK